MWRWPQKRSREGFPPKFKRQRIGVPEAKAVADLPPAEIAAYFRTNQEVANALLTESYDKRYSPSSYITEQGREFEVGWYSRGRGRECTRNFSNVADAATDYLLLSLGKPRWTPPEGTGPG